MTRVTLVLKTNEGGLWVLPQLLALLNEGASVIAVIPPGDGRLRRALDDHAIPVVESPFDFTFRPRPRTFLTLLRLRRTILDTRPDVVFYHLYASALAARLSTLGCRVRRVHMVAGPLYLESMIIKAAERILMRSDDHLIAGSKYTARLYRAMGMPTGRVSTIPYGVDLSAFSADRVPDRSTHDVYRCMTDDSSRSLVVVMVAYVYAPKSAVFPGVGIKGHEVLLEAWRTFSVEQPRARLILVGSGFDEAGEQHRQVLLQKYSVGDDPSIEWHEKVQDVRPYYLTADLSVSPSLSDNHGAVLEASAMGLPSIVSDAGGLPETVTWASGWVVPSGDVGALLDILRLASSEHTNGDLATKGLHARRHMSAHFDVEVCASCVAQRVLG